MEYKIIGRISTKETLEALIPAIVELDGGLDTVRLDSIELALEHPEIAGWTPTGDDLAFLQQHRPEVILQYKLKRTPRLCDLPPEEQEPFRKWLEGQTLPYIEGIPREEQDFFYQHDYDRWKKDHNAWNM